MWIFSEEVFTIIMVLFIMGLVIYLGVLDYRTYTARRLGQEENKIKAALKIKEQKHKEELRLELSKYENSSDETLRELCEEKTKIEQQLEKALKQSTNFDKFKRHHRKECTRLQKAVADANQAYVDLNTRLTNEWDQFASEASEIQEKLIQELKESKEEKQGLREQLEKQQARFDASLAESDKEKRKFQKLLDLERTEHGQKVQTMENTNTEHGKRMEKLQQKLDETRIEHSQLRKTLEERHAENQRLQKGLEKKTMDHWDCKDSLEDSNKLYLELERQYNEKVVDLSKKLVKSEVEYREMREQIEDVFMELEGLHHENQILKKTLSNKLKDKLEMKQEPSSEWENVDILDEKEETAAEDFVKIDN